MYVNNVCFHHARVLKPVLEVYPELEIRYLPLYSPDLNLVERVGGICIKALLITAIWPPSENASPGSGSYSPFV
jgi:transposase